MRRTTVFIDDKLLEEAMAFTSAKSKREVIEEGLRVLIHRKNVELLRRELGTFDLDLSLKKLKKLRSKD